MRWGVATCVAAMLMIVAPRAYAQEYYYTEYERQWYGWQTIAVDAPLLTTYYIAQRSGEAGVAYGTLGVFVVGAPVVHLAHGKAETAVLSGGTHLLFPLASVVTLRPLFSKIAPDSSTDARTAAAVVLAGAGASVLDALVFAYDEKETRVPIEHGGGWWRPMVSVGKGSLSLGVGGGF